MDQRKVLGDSHEDLEKWYNCIEKNTSQLNS